MSALARNRSLRVGIAVLLPFVTLAVQSALWPWLQPYAWVLFFPTAFLSVRIGGRTAGVVAALESAVIVWFFFIPPRYSFAIANVSGAVSIAGFLMSGLLFADIQGRLERALDVAVAARDESESKFQGVVEQSLAGIYTIQDGVFLHVNDLFAQMLGYATPAEIDGILRADVLSSDGSPEPKFECSLEDVESSSSRSHRVQVCRKDGEVIDLQLHASCFELDGRPATVGLAIDVTRESEAERRYLEQQELLSHIEAIAKIGGWEFDPATGTGSWTDELALLHDLDPAQSIDVSRGLDFYTPESRPIIERAVADVVQLQRPYDLELEIISAKGVHKSVRTIGFPVVEDGRVVKVRGTMQDISDRKSDERARRESQSRYKDLFDATTEGIAFCEMFFDAEGNPVDWRYDQVNPAFSKITGIEGAQGKLVSEILPGIDKTNPELFVVYGNVAKTGEPAEFETYVPLLERGQWLSVAVTRPGPNQFGAFFHDITERKEAEGKVLELNATLERRVEQRTAEVVAANRELESFAYAVSHDLRAPLRAMSGFAQALAEDYSGSIDETARGYIDHITAGSRRMAELIDGLLTLSRATRGDLVREPVDVSSLSESVLAELRTLHPERTTQWQIQPGITIDADPRMAAALMRNLLSNAWKYSSKTEGARIDVTQTTDEDGTRWVCVTDNGAGFDAQFSSQLFRPFCRLHTQDEFVGIGIGLATVKRIIDRHGGRITADGEIDHGARFCFTLPASGDAGS